MSISTIAQPIRQSPSLLARRPLTHVQHIVIWLISDEELTLLTQLRPTPARGEVFREQKAALASIVVLQHLTLLFCTSLTPNLLGFLVKETYDFIDCPYSPSFGLSKYHGRFPVWTGECLSSVVPSPNWPYSFSPQVQMVPSALRATV